MCGAAGASASAPGPGPDLCGAAHTGCVRLKRVTPGGKDVTQQKTARSCHTHASSCLMSGRRRPAQQPLNPCTRFLSLNFSAPITWRPSPSCVRDHKGETK